MRHILWEVGYGVKSLAPWFLGGTVYAWGVVMLLYALIELLCGGDASGGWPETVVKQDWVEP